tara:strand:- start:1544 stop:2209 length:666 start_codon:yes stop_codon:yes gene_type:complete
MADTRISKIKVRQGDFTDLPMLDAGELGYATDNHRLFVGNTTISVGTGNGVINTFVVPTTLNANGVIGVFVAGAQVNPADYTIIGTTLTFSTPPAGSAAITAQFNGEISMERYATIPNSLSLAASGTSAVTGFSVDTSLYNIAIIDYTLESTNGVRVGQLRLATDTSASTSAIDDNYTETSAVDITFSADISVANTLRLMYTDGANAITKFKYTYQLWNSN